IHFLISEHWAAYHRFWSTRVFGRYNRWLEHFNPWNRYRLARACKIVLVIVVGAIVLGRLLDVSPFVAYIEGIGRLVDIMPTFLQAAAFILFWIGGQFALIVYFATRGGVETFFPDDIRTRFSDVWGQDPVLHKVRENLLFLEQPEIIEN